MSALLTPASASGMLDDLPGARESWGQTQSLPPVCEGSLCLDPAQPPEGPLPGRRQKVTQAGSILPAISETTTDLRLASLSFRKSKSGSRLEETTALPSMPVHPGANRSDVGPEQTRVPQAPSSTGWQDCEGLTVTGGRQESGQHHAFPRCCLEA